MTRRPEWPAVGQALDDDDLKSVLGASAGARNAVLEQRMRDALVPVPFERATPTRRGAPPPPARSAPPPSPRASAPGARAPSASAPRASAAILDELERLAELRDRGVITDDEFAAFKQRVLSSR